MEEQVKVETTETTTEVSNVPMVSDSNGDYLEPTIDEGKGFDLQSGIIGAAITLVGGGIAIGIKKAVDWNKNRKAKKEADARDKAEFEAFKAAQAAKAKEEANAEVVEVSAEDIKPEAETKEELKAEKKK